MKAGRAGCAASFRPRVSPPSSAKKTSKKKRQNKKRRRGKGGKPAAATDGAVTAGPGCCPAVELESGKLEVELPAVGLLVNSSGTGGKRQFRSDKGKQDVGGEDEAADGGGEKRPHRPPQKRKLSVGDGLPGADVQLADLDVGGQYKIPKKREKND